MLSVLDSCCPACDSVFKVNVLGQAFSPLLGIHTIIPVLTLRNPLLLKIVSLERVYL